MALSDTAIRTAKATDKPYKLSDEKGLFVLVMPNGAKYWLSISVQIFPVAQANLTDFFRCLKR